MAVDAPALLPDGGAGELTVFRWASYDVPFWARENTDDGRWNYAGEGQTQYWAMSPEASWAELIRAEDLTTEAELDLVRMPFWVARIPSAGLLDLTRSEQRERYGVQEEDLISDAWELCQRLAVQLRDDVRGVLAPSAAMPTHANVTLFGARRAIDWMSRPRLASAVPTARAAIGRPPGGLLDQVRRRAGAPPGDRLF